VYFKYRYYLDLHNNLNGFKFAAADIELLLPVYWIFLI